jgi:hypothetical protein
MLKTELKLDYLAFIFLTFSILWLAFPRFGTSPISLSLFGKECPLLLINISIYQLTPLILGTIWYVET